MNDLRLELRARNNVLWHAIFDTYQSVADFCRVFAFHQSDIGGWLNLTVSPYSLLKSELGQLNGRASRLCAVLGYSADELFPVGLYAKQFPAKLAAEVPSERFVALSAAKRLPALSSHEDAVMADEMRAAIHAALDTLTPRQKQVLEMRLGLAGDDESTLREVATRFNCTPECIRQVEATALRKLRHPSRSRQLKPFLEQ